MSAMDIPPKLVPGDRVHIVAPCGVFAREAFEQGIQVLELAGFKPVFEESLFERERYLAGGDEKRCQEILRALSDSTAKAIWVARGGFGATRIVPQLPVMQVREARKWLIGFSDVTALHALWQKAHVMSVHGPNITTLATWEDEARTELWSALAGPHGQSFQGQSRGAEHDATGVLAGGNLAVLTALIGTAEMPDFAGKLVLLEDIGEAPYKLDRMLTQHRQAGTFSGAKGILVGQLTRCEPAQPTDYTALDVVVENLQCLKIPILTQLPFGHEESARAIFLGASGRIEWQSGTLEVTCGDVTKASE